MAFINSKEQICNMSMSHMGLYGSINNIDTPTTDKEIAFAIWYDVTRQKLLKELIPNFAVRRKTVSKKAEVPNFGYAYAYEYPVDALRILGIGNIEDKENNYAIEGQDILSDEDYTDGMPIRYVFDETDVTKFSPEFKIQLSWELSGNTVLEVTQDPAKANSILAAITQMKSSVAAMSAQENIPLRKSVSKFKLARYDHDPRLATKK